MKGLVLTLGVAVALIPFRPDRYPPAPAPPAPRPDLEQLQGAWQVILYQTSDQTLDAAALKGKQLLIFKGNEYRWGANGAASTFTLDATRTPKAVYYGPGQQPWEGIYEIDGDIFRDCIAPPGKPRPISFSTPPGSGHILQVHRRVPN